jgi:hypothetical protein
MYIGNRIVKIRLAIVTAAISVVLFGSVHAQERASKGNSPSTVGKTTKPARSTTADPVDSFKTLIERGRSRVDQQTGVLSEGKPPTEYRKWRYTISQLKYDVRKTESLVSPIIGIAVVDLLIDFSAPITSKEDAERATNYSHVQSVYRLTLNYYYSNNKWVFREGDAKGVGEIGGGEDFHIDPEHFKSKIEYLVDKAHVDNVAMKFLP